MSWKILGAICLTLSVATPLAAQHGQGGAQGEAHEMGMQERSSSMQHSAGSMQHSAGSMQHSGGHGAMPAGLLSLRTTLELTDDQIEQLESLQKSFAEQHQAHVDHAREMREQVHSGDMTRSEAHEMAKTHQEARHEACATHHQTVEEVLTDEQQGKLTEIREAVHNRRPGQVHPRGHGQRQFRRGRSHHGSRQGFQKGHRGSGGPGGPHSHSGHGG